MIPHDARQYLFERLRTLDPDEVERLRRLSLAGRLRWAVECLRQRYPELSLSQLARQVGISRQALWAILQGRTARPSAPVITGLCHALGLPVFFVMLGLVPEDLGTENGLPAELVRFALNPANAAYVRPALELAVRCSELGLDPGVIEHLREVVRSMQPRPARRA